MGQDFETDKNYNVEQYVSVTLETNKTCYFGGEMINGTITLRPKEGLSNPLLSSPFATLRITENFHYTYTEKEYCHSKHREEFVTKHADESMTIVELPMNFTNFQNANIMNTVVIPFQVQLPLTVYPSILIDGSCYVKHFLSIDFPSILAKKTVIIVVKNPKYYSTYNGLVKEPAVCFKNIEKGVFTKESFTTTLTLPRNYFAYDEVIPFTVDIDSTHCKSVIKGLKITINRNFQKNFQHNHMQHRDENKKEICEKIIPLMKGQKVHHIQDTIQLTNKNPKPLYDQLDNDHRKYSEKYNDVHIYPTCYGGLLSCEYYIKLVVQMESLFSTDEALRLPIDLHCPYVPQQAYPQQYPPQQPPQYPPQYPPQQPPQYPPQQVPPQQPQEQQNNNDSLPTMDEILQKPVENNNNNNNPPPPSTGGNNNNFNYPSF